MAVDPEIPREPSLIQQRMALDRKRNASFVQGFLAVPALWLFATGFDGEWSPFDVGAIALAVVTLAIGTISFARYRAERRAFEAEHGRDAGKQ